MITAYEVLRGDDSEEDIFWNDFFSKVQILNFDLDASRTAGAIYRDLKSKGTLIETEDLLIGAIAHSNKMKLATNNTKHLNRITGLVVI